MSEKGRRYMRAMGAIAALTQVGATDLTIGTRERLLAAQNRERDLIGVPPLAWNAALAVDAARWAEHLAATGRLEHSHDDGAGENIWAGTPDRFALEAMVDGWAREKRDFVPGTFPANSRTGKFADIGHYTQLVWRRTREVGCAVAHGATQDVLVCRYAEPGNVVGERPF